MKHYGLKGQLCILIALLLLAPILYFGDDYANSYPQPDLARWTESVHFAAYEGKAPEWYGGANIASGENVLYVTEDCPKTSVYFEKIVGPDKPWAAVVRAKYSMNHAALSFIEVKQLLREEWCGEYEYTVSAGLLSDERGVRIHMELTGGDAEYLWNELQGRYGDLIVEDTGRRFYDRLITTGGEPELPVGFPEPWKPLLPVFELKSVAVQ